MREQERRPKSEEYWSSSFGRKPTSRREPEVMAVRKSNLKTPGFRHAQALKLKLNLLDVGLASYKPSSTCPRAQCFSFTVGLNPMNSLQVALSVCSWKTHSFDFVFMTRVFQRGIAPCTTTPSFLSILITETDPTTYNPVLTVLLAPR